MAADMAILFKAYRIVFMVALGMLPLVILHNNWVYLLFLWLMYVTYLILQRKARQVLPVDRKAVLITGCDTGFGHYLAQRLDSKGFTVFAGVLHEYGEGANELRSEQSDRLHVIKLDVTKDDDVAMAVSYVNKICLKNEFWGVVNNAGFYIPGDLELCTMSQLKGNADVNLYGYIRIIKAFLPLIRKSKGRVVNISSVRGLYSCPELSAYNMTKFAIEAMSDALRLEMQKFGIKVVIVQPGVYDGCTAISSPEQIKRMKEAMEEMWEAATEEVRNAYGREYLDQIITHLEGDKGAKTWMSPLPVLCAIEDGLLNTNPKQRYLIGGAGFPVDIYALLGRIYKFLPDFIADAIVGKALNRYHSTYHIEF